MRASRILGVLAGTTAIALATLTVAAPASAAKLPLGQKATIVENYGEVSPGQFYDVNTDTGASAPIGSPSEFALEGIEVADDGIGAAIGFATFGEDDSPTPAIFPANANTGTLGAPVQILFNGDVPLDLCEGIDLVNGTFLISCVFNDDVVSSYVGQVNVTTGEFIPFITLDGEDYLQFQAIANDVVTAQLWGFALVGGATIAFQIDLENDIVTEFGEFDEPVFGADFDRDGKLWVSTLTQLTDPEIDLPAIALADPFMGTQTDVRPYVDIATDTSLVVIPNLTIWGALAATGSTPAPSRCPSRLGSALLLLAGAAFIATVADRSPQDGLTGFASGLLLVHVALAEIREEGDRARDLGRAPHAEVREGRTLA